MHPSAEILRVHEKKCPGFAIAPKKTASTIQGVCNQCGERLESYARYMRIVARGDGK